MFYNPCRAKNKSMMRRITSPMQKNKIDKMHEKENSVIASLIEKATKTSDTSTQQVPRVKQSTLNIDQQLKLIHEEGFDLESAYSKRYKKHD